MSFMKYFNENQYLVYGWLLLIFSLFAAKEDWNRFIIMALICFCTGDILDEIRKKK